LFLQDDVGMVSKGLRAFTCQVTAKIEAGYYAKKTTESLINDTALIFFISLIHLHYVVSQCL
jgi:hypothetical protein